MATPEITPVAAESASLQVQSIGASAEFGNMQGAVVNVLTRQGGERFQFDTSYYGQEKKK